MTYTTQSLRTLFRLTLFMDYILLFLNDIHNYSEEDAKRFKLFMDYILLFLNDEQNLFFIHNLQFFLVLDRISNPKGSDY